jgi:hypothetical protein
MRRLYDAAIARDGEAMAGCYAPDATFQDEVFTLAGHDVGDMWRMVMGRSADLRVSYEIVDESSARWIADYTFEGRPVHNEITSTFTFAPDGRIQTQRDRFDFARWAGQALGLPGKLLGRFGFFQNAVRKNLAGRLAAWQRRHGSEGSAGE